jgi:prepilin-type processing-associated H-X9-DG protein
MQGPPLNPAGDSGVGIQNFCMNRHNGYVNGLFLDWSVRQVGVKELWTLNWYTEFNRVGRWTKAGGVKSQNWPRWMQEFRDY